MTILLAKAIKIAGGQTALARDLSKIMRRHVSQSIISTWLKRSQNPGFRGIPADYCPAIEKITQGKVPAKKLRPDVFGRLITRRKK